MAFVRLVVLGFIAMTVVYFSISIYSRSVRREKLENSWDEEPPEGGDAAAREMFIERGMAKYEDGFRKKLILLVYVVPTCAVAAIIYFTN